MAREVQSSIVEKCVVVLDLLARATGNMSYSEIAETTGYNKSSTHRILSILMGQGLVQLDERNKSYSVGPKLVSWARSAWQKTDLNQIEDTDLSDLSKATGMNVAVAVLSDNSVTFIRTNIIRPYKLAVKIGGQSELHCTAVGKVFLAYMEPLEREEYLRTAEMEKYTETTLTTPDALSRDIAQVRERGYAIADREEFYQVVGMAAPILDYEDRILAALSLWIPTRFASLEELQSNAPALLETASTISKRFGSMA